MLHLSHTPISKTKLIFKKRRKKSNFDKKKLKIKSFWKQQVGVVLESGDRWEPKKKPLGFISIQFIYSKTLSLWVVWISICKMGRWRGQRPRGVSTISYFKILICSHTKLMRLIDSVVWLVNECRDIFFFGINPLSKANNLKCWHCSHVLTNRHRHHQDLNHLLY